MLTAVDIYLSNTVHVFDITLSHSVDNFSYLFNVNQNILDIASNILLPKCSVLIEESSVLSLLTLANVLSFVKG